MKNRLIILGLLMQAGLAHAWQPLQPPGLLPAPQARSMLEQDPRVAAAHAGRVAGREDARAIESSPYEWNAKLSGQRRRLDSGPHYREWNAALERTLRLPGKAAADRDIGAAIVDESEARYGEAVHEAAKDLVTLWVDWITAEHARDLAAGAAQGVRESVTAVEKRLKAGDASRLDLGLARAELSEQLRLQSEAAMQASAAWTRLSARFPSFPRDYAALPMPQPIEGGVDTWRERILEQSDELKILDTQFAQARAHAARARADRLPDPTVSVYTASEVGGEERIAGVSLSMPIPGEARAARSGKAAAMVNVSQQELEATKRELSAHAGVAVALARGSYESLQLAVEAAGAMRDNAALMLRAYQLGEAELQSLLQARRQSNAASLTALQAQADALKAYYGLLIDAHLIWDLEHD